ncbi:MAG: Rpn family recombination-promoting nuclease/putative transposase [Chthoniobacterales bacterium]|nr:Rpn family recombination-promoting nuclease/putative transposase [Chthoniobacterales bacterium]
MNKQSEDQKLFKAHDRYFRGAMDDPDVAMSCIRAHLPPEIVAQIDINSLQLMKGSFIEGNLREKITDVLYKATIDGEAGYIYFLIEHQSTPDPFMPLRLHHYILQIIERDLTQQKKSENFKNSDAKKSKKLPKLPLVVPHVIYNGQSDYSCSTDIFDLFHDPEKARKVFLQPFGLTVLKDIKDDQLKKESLIGMVELLLKHASARDMVSLINEVLGGILQTFEILNKPKLFYSSISYLFETQEGNMSKKEINEEFERLILPANTKTKIMTIAESLKLEGHLEGRQEGLQEGLHQFRSLLIRQLKARFSNKVTPHYLNLIKEADSDKLAYLGERLMNASNIEEVFSCF